MKGWRIPGDSSDESLLYLDNCINRLCSLHQLVVSSSHRLIVCRVASNPGSSSYVGVKMLRRQQSHIVWSDCMII